MTEAQEKAFQEIRKLATDHFDCSLFVFETESPDSANNWVLNYTTMGGSSMTALGLAEYARHRLLNPDEVDEETL